MAGILDAFTFRRALAEFERALRTHRDELNSLNVFPVPDGDTGTNLLLTAEAVCGAVDELGADVSMSGVCDAVARASLMGARGNSGVILSQVFRGMCETLAAAEAAPDAVTVAVALRHAGAEAYRAVARPVEGTVLTVLHEAAEAAETAAAASASNAGRTLRTGRVLEAALRAARESLARTTDTLPALRAAGVVDSGGKGVVLLLDAMRSAVLEVPLSEPVGPAGPVGTVGDSTAVPAVTFGFEVQYLLEAADDQVVGLRLRLNGLGDSLVVVGGGRLFNVHVHTNEPDAAVEAAREIGVPSRITVVDLRDRVAECMAGHARAVRVAEQATALVAVADGEGVAGAFRSLGAVVVPADVGSEGPLTRRLTVAIDAAPARAVLVLPNRSDLVAAARRAAAESSKDARVVATASIPAGLSAATAFNPVAGVEENARAAEEAAAACRSAEADAAGVVAQARALVDTAADPEVLTLITGAAAGRDQAGAIVAELRSAFPALKVEVMRGGQPSPAYLVGLE